MTDVRDTQLDALLDRAADSGVDFDGLHITADSAGYTLEIDESDVRRENLTEADVRATAHEDDVAPYITNWYYWEEVVGHSGRHRRAFLRHAEVAEEHSVPERYEALRSGLQTEWGDVLVTATLAADGHRRYEVRHADDDGVDTAELDVYEDPLAAREIATYDETGRYRPLKTAPSLVSGWVFPDLDGRDAVETLDVLYPASVANWNLEREGELDVTHWRETAERQTGIYDVVEDLPPAAVDWMAEACCVDSQCLKRREWEYDADHELDADGGDGAFPCREPCSLVVAAARKWTKLEEEETQTYEFELTPSEKEQIEAIIDAVADDRTDEIREADVYEGANRYRARYLRAKRFDDEGNLSGTATHPEDGEDGHTEHGDEH
ncbi:DR2241 family protein [Halobellus marinus]|uniref:DR2241 family protein n=1 Tax=Halobellus TaxID=1073986 RepID=UPI0028A95B79|nr:DR2241 family protein [Halobellus sp. DFY28]